MAAATRGQRAKLKAREGRHEGQRRVNSEAGYLKRRKHILTGNGKSRELL